ncbi:hypothetical protein [Wansuia hejianensis]|uniref:Uncharacterized protein n=1 Tax=Wansuia hejianensis TaxID=2763667 RepID=A0A7G9GF04_9FIRM|nr:hypothetical protein [Wansuia hejianensis]QNM09386.1 hypothetical protein H9Q79_03620 [Wansuia hejianensis]
MKNQKRHSRKLLSILLVLCMALTIVPITAFAAGVNYIDKISVTYTAPDYKAGDAPQAAASVTEGECSVAYEYWREIEQKTEGSVWTGTGRYWYSDSSKMASLAADKQITQFEAGHHYSYNIVLKTNSGYFISDDTIVSVGDYEWGKAGSDTNLEIKEMSTELRIYSPYSIDLPAASTDEVITTVDIGNVWKKLDSSQPVAFTAEVNPNNSACSGKVEIVEEAWEKSTYGESTPITDVIKSTDTSRNPIAGGEYWYSIALKAKEGYVFSDNVTFICEGITYTAQTANTSVSDNGKTFTAWEFLLPVIVSDGADDTVIKDVEVIGATLSYNEGDTPKATAMTKDIGANYEIAYESWAETEQYAFWYSNEDYYPEHFGGRFTSFEEGKSYRYSILLKVKNGRTFAATDSGLTVTVNGWTVEQQNISVNPDGQSVHVTGIATITPTKPVEPKEIEVIEINNATITFKDGDKPVFTGNVPDNKDYAFRCEWWSLDSDTGLVSTEPEWGSEIYKNKITTFEAGKTYHYGVYVTAYYGNFSPDARLKINGQYVNYKRVGDDDNMQTMWLETDLTMTPFDSSHTHSYGADWKSDSDNHWHECSCGSIADKAAHDMETKNAKDATATEKGYTGDKVCKVCGYTVKGKEIPVSGTTKPTNPTKPDGNTDVTSPKTGDNSNLALWFAVLFISCGGVIGVTVYSRRRKLNKR